MPQTHQSTRNVRGTILFAFAVALAIYVAWLVRGMLVLLYVAALFAVALTPVVRATSQLRIGRWRPFHGATAILILLVAVALAFTAFGFLAFPPVIHDLQALRQSPELRASHRMDSRLHKPRGHLRAVFARGLGGSVLSSDRRLCSHALLHS